MKLQNKSIIVTGANQGLGFEMARHFLLAGANVTICARDQEKLKKAKMILSAIPDASTRLFALPVDISKPEEINTLFNFALEKMGALNVLVANAAIHGPKGMIDEVDWSAWSEAIDINLKGSVLCARAALPYFKKQQSGKIIFLSGGGATKPMPFMSAYAASKAAIVRFCETLSEELKPFGVDVNAIAPGALNTRLLADVLAAGPEKVGVEKYQQALKQKVEGGDSLSHAANLAVFLSSALSDGITGKLISAIWDPWKQLPDFLNDLNTSDIYTLRRILPKERGKTWGEME